MVDFAGQGKATIDQNLLNEMTYYGLPADVYAVVVQPNAYQDSTTDPIDDPFLNANPDTTWATSPRASVVVRLGNSIGGLNIGSIGISESDKIKTEIDLVCLSNLATGEKLVIHYPDGHLFTVRIIKALAQDDYSQINYQYTARVT